MSNMDKDILARLRGERQAQVAAARERIREQGRVLRLIRRHLEKGPDTVPGIARATGLSPREALWFLTAMRKYGLASEGDKQGGYFQYALSSSEPPAGEEAAQ